MKEDIQLKSKELDEFYMAYKKEFELLEQKVEERIKKYLELTVSQQ